MAIKVNGKAVKAKVRAMKNPLFGDEKYTGPEPVWDAERAMQLSDEEFDHRLAASFRYYNYYFTQKDLKKHVIAWAKERKEFEDADHKLLNNITDRALPMTVCSIIMAHRQGMPFRQKHLDYVVENVNRAMRISESDPDEDAPVAKAKPWTPSIQDRLNEKTAETIGELEWHFDEILKNPKHVLKPYDFLTSKNVPQSQLAKYETLYQARADELKAAQAKEDEQLVEAYSYLKAADMKRIIAFVDAILDDIVQYRGVKKATKKVRAPRAVSKEKVVSKLKYLKEEKTLKLISVNPADIIGAQELFVYNVKTRKLGHYICDSLQGQLTVKGASIVGYDEIKSVAKTLRKPEEKLKEFAKAGKVQLRKFLSDIKATETKLNGRVNADTILLKVL